MVVESWQLLSGPKAEMIAEEVEASINPQHKGVCAGIAEVVFSPTITPKGEMVSIVACVPSIQRL